MQIFVKTLTGKTITLDVEAFLALTYGIALTTAVLGTLTRDVRQLELMPFGDTYELAPPPTILEPVVEALRHLEKNFRHIINLTTKKPEGAAQHTPDAPMQVSCPTARDICELGVRVRMLGEYLHPDARSTLDKAYGLQQTACEQMRRAYNLYDGLMRAADSARSLVPLPWTWRSEWKASAYTLWYMMARRADARSALAKPLRRSQEEWERVFLANKPTQLHATEASWRAAIKDAKEEAEEASGMFCEVTRLLREATQMEVLRYRQDKLLKTRQTHKSLLCRHIRVQNEFGKRHDRISQDMINTIQEQLEAATHYDEESRGDGMPSYDSLIRLTIPQDLQELDLALKDFMGPELEYRGKKVRTRAAVFDHKLESIHAKLSDLQEHIRRAEGINEALDAAADVILRHPFS